MKYKIFRVVFGILLILLVISWLITSFIVTKNYKNDITSGLPAYFGFILVSIIYFIPIIITSIIFYYFNKKQKTH